MLQKDITKLRINNKLKNVNFLLKFDVFSNLLTYINANTDNSFVYVPIKYNRTEIINSVGKKEIIEFDYPRAENNYADLIVKNGYINNSFKAVRVKSLSAISLDGSHVSWDYCAMNHNNYLVFYSTNPNEMGKMIVMTTKTYSDFILKYAPTVKANLINLNKIEKIKELFGLSDKELKYIDYSKEVEVEDCEFVNLYIKHQTCLKTLNEINKDDEFFTKKRTHYGKQYIGYNLKNGTKIIFRDCIARNNFFNFNTNIKLADNHVINRNCKHQDLVANGSTLDKYQMNIYEDEDWIITSYIKEDSDFIDYIKRLFIRLIKLSVTWKNRLMEYICDILETIELAFEKIIIIKNKLKDKLSYFRPLHLLEYITCSDNVTMNDYFNERPYMEHFYLKA